MKNQNGNLLIIVPIFLLVLGGIYFLSTQNTVAEIPKTTENAQGEPSVVVAAPSNESLTAFQRVLSTNCKNGQIPLKTLPLSIELDNMPITHGNCNSGLSTYSNFVHIPFINKNEFITISDEHSAHCCHGPSSLEGYGKLIRTEGDIKIYIHTGIWSPGANSGYRSIMGRGVKDFKLTNGEKLRVVVDKEVINKDDADLRKVQDKYQVIDRDFDSGLKVFTPEIADKMLEDSFFMGIKDSPAVSEIEKNLNSISYTQ